MTPNIPAGDPRPESGCEPPKCNGAGDLSPGGCDVARDLNVLTPMVADRVGEGRKGG